LIDRRSVGVESEAHERTIGEEITAVTVADDKLYVGTADGSLSAFGSAGKQVSSNRGDTEIYGQPSDTGTETSTQTEVYTTDDADSGSSTDTDVYTSSDTGTETPSYCPGCGGALAEYPEASFCPECGKSL
jgi:membrane protease subunit (stomatin/prohibitin family)